MPFFVGSQINAKTTYLQRVPRFKNNWGAVEIRLAQQVIEWTLDRTGQKAQMTGRTVLLEICELPFLGLD